MAYSCLFFDLDHTLWDYETNSKEALCEVYEQFGLHLEGIHNPVMFCEIFQEINMQLWESYDTGKIDAHVIRNDRFKIIFKHFNVNNDRLAQKVGAAYMVTCPTKAHLFPGAIETLEYLSHRYELSVITNGFEETQHAKLAASKLTSFFDHVITSQRAGFKKPSKEIFDYALKCHDILSCHAVMIGDNLITDMGGAKNASLDSVFFNPNNIKHSENVNFEISSLKELCDLF